MLVVFSISFSKYVNEFPILDKQLMINGLTFTPGALFTDTATEVWGVYYPSSRGGFPYTIFYKNTLQLLAQQSITLTSQISQLFNPFNEYLGWMEEFSMKGNEMETTYFIRRKNRFNNPKTWTALLPEGPI